MENTTDLLKIKIEDAKKQLPESTLVAINAVPWQATILQMRETKRYTFEQLQDLETETELLLCGLLSPENYPKELENRMRLSKTEVSDLVKEMNNLVFSKIKEELIKNTEKRDGENKNTQIFRSAGIEIVEQGETLPVPKKLELNGAEESHPVRSRPLEDESATVTLGQPASNGTHPILAQKLSGFTQGGLVETHHSLDNITKTNTPSPADTKPKIPPMDPYREIPE